MTISARTASDPRYVAAHLSPLMAATIRHAYWYKATYFRVDPILRRTVWALRRRGLIYPNKQFHCDVLTPFGEQVRRVLKGVES